MGSFSEVVLGFSFRPDAPDHVLAAFSALAVPSSPDVYGHAAPELPPPNPPEDDYWEPTNEIADPAADPAPWRHDWALWMSSSTGVSITPCAQMTWSKTGRWTVSCRWGVKSWPQAILPALLWLGPFLDGGDRLPVLLGYIGYYYEDGPRPTLLWLIQGRILAQDLSRPA